MPLSVATWNVNSLKVRLPHLLDWLGRHAVDVVCLQETKLTDDRFPAAELQAAGYRSVFAGQKTYNGVAILLRGPDAAATEVQVNLPNFDDEQKRLLAVTHGGLRIVNGYFPNGQAVGSDKFEYKLAWLAALTDWLRGELARHGQLLLAGDFNIAPEPRDVHAPALWEGQALFSEPERAGDRYPGPTLSAAGRARLPAGPPSLARVERANPFSRPAMMAPRRILRDMRHADDRAPRRRAMRVSQVEGHAPGRARC